MNKFESEMKLFFKNYDKLQDTLFYHNIMIGRLNNVLNVKVSFTNGIEADRYYGMLVEIINKETGIIDKQFFNFSNIIGKAPMVSGTSASFYLWNYRGDIDWYGSAPTAIQRKKFTEVVCGIIFI